MINIQRALSITGFMTEPELAWLATQAQRSILIAEVGCWQGRSTRALADNTHGTVFAIDHFQGVPELLHFLHDKPPYWLLKTFLMNLIDRDNVIVVRKSSYQAALLLGELAFDMVFIDGDHGYASVAQDIQWWQPLVIEGGLLCGHDYRDAAEVEQAVLEANLPNVEIVPNTSIWCSRL